MPKSYKIASNLIDFTKYSLFWVSTGALLLPSLAFGFSGSGAGTQGDPYQVSDCNELQEMDDDRSAHYILVNNIDCSDTVNWNSGAGFSPVGPTSANSFSGSFDGQNYAIRDLFINRPSTQYVGLFGFSEGDLSNLYLLDVDITGDREVGSLVGQLSGNSTVSKCVSSGSVSASGTGVGGLIGVVNNSDVSQSYSAVNVSDSGSTQNIGGLVGNFKSGTDHFIVDSYATGNVSASSATNVGGLVGRFRDGDLLRSYASGDVDGDDSVGGLTGVSFGLAVDPDVEDSYSRGDVSGNSDVGGLMGGNTGNLDNVVFDVSRSGTPTCVGNGTDTGCSGVNPGSTQASYFFDNNTNSPLDQWDFTTVWQTCSGSDPVLIGECSGSLTSTNVEPASLLHSTVNTVTVSFTTANLLPNDGKVVVIFPAGFALNSGGNTEASNLSNVDGVLSASVSSQTLTLTRSGGSQVAAGTAVSFDLSNIKNPSSTGSTGNYTIITRKKADITIDQDTTVSADTISECPAGTFGSSCSACPGGSASPCNGNGSCDDGVLGTGECSCSSGFTGSSCSDCQSGLYSSDCSSQCPGGSSNACNGQGSCDDGISGSGLCSCASGFSGASCNDCSSGNFGAACSECPGGSANPCSGNGSCDDGISGAGTCSCNEGFSGTSCDQCESGYFGSSCSLCPGAGNCSGHGSCDQGITGTGVCSCELPYTGSDCSELIELATPTIKVKIKRGKARFICKVAGNPEGVEPSAYVFKLKGKRGAKPKRKTITSSKKSVKMRLTSGGSYKVTCSYQALGLSSSKVKKKFRVR